MKLQIQIISYEEMIENQQDQERDTEDEQTFVSASLSACPDEAVSNGYYNGKPRDLVQIFRESDDGMRGEDEE
jgi:hypothetical protein